jgi:hypothetical protein
VQLARDGTPVLAFTGVDTAVGMFWAALGLLLVGLALILTRRMRRIRRA